VIVKNTNQNKKIKKFKLFLTMQIGFDGSKFNTVDSDSPCEFEL